MPYDVPRNSDVRAASAVLPEAHVTSKDETAPLRRQFDGIDVFVEWHGDVDSLAAKMRRATTVGDFRLSTISNRGTVLWPNGAETADSSPHWRCRFTTMEGAKIAEMEVPWLLSVIGEHIRWMHVEKLESLSGTPAYSRALSEA